MENYTERMYSDALGWWLDALESGQYPQTQNTMCLLDEHDRPVGFCCLGVLCEVAQEHGVPLTIDSTVRLHRVQRRYDGASGSMLPARVQEWAGIRSPWVSLGEHAAAYHNDEQRQDFAAIAALIRQYVRPIPRPDTA